MRPMPSMGLIPMTSTSILLHNPWVVTQIAMAGLQARKCFIPSTNFHSYVAGLHTGLQTQRELLKLIRCRHGIRGLKCKSHAISRTGSLQVLNDVFVPMTQVCDSTQLNNNNNGSGLKTWSTIRVQIIKMPQPSDRIGSSLPLKHIPWFQIQP